MKNLVLITSLILLTAAIGLGQKTSVDGKSSGAGNVSGRAGDKVLLSSGSNIDAQLMSTVDVKKSKVGDQVLLKTTKAIKENGKTIIPKGTSLIGRITEVQQKTKQNAMSKIGMVFERIEGRDLSAPISASIISITNIASSASIGDAASSDIFASSSSSGSASAGKSGGLLGGVGSTVGGVLNTTTQTAGGVVNTAGQTVGSTTGTLGRTVNGIQISQSASGSANGSTSLSSQNKNLRLEKGVMFQLQVNSSVQN